MAAASSSTPSRAHAPEISRSIEAHDLVVRVHVGPHLRCVHGVLETQAGIIHLCIEIESGALEPLIWHLRLELEHFLTAQVPHLGDSLLSRQLIVEVEPQLDIPAWPPLPSIEGEQKGTGPDQIGSQLQKQRAF
jgi:hypothetical protein